MHEEPFRWIEAIANRREYIEDQLAPGSPVVALTCAPGILLLTFSRERQKLFEIHDRIALGGIGHPGDIERLRLSAIELASMESFTRSSADVSLRRLANYTLSPALKAAFEQVYGPPFLARLLFAELGRHDMPDWFLRLDYDGTIHAGSSTLARSHSQHGVIAGTSTAIVAMEDFLNNQPAPALPLAEALRHAARAWAVGHLAGSGDAAAPETATLDAHWQTHTATHSIEAALLEREAPAPIAYRALSDAEARTLLGL